MQKFSFRLNSESSRAQILEVKIWVSNCIGWLLPKGDQKVMICNVILNVEFSDSFFSLGEQMPQDTLFSAVALRVHLLT